jgi:hypothetical protein
MEYGLDGRDSNPVTEKFFSLHVVQTGSGTRSASYPTGTGVDFPGGKVAGCEVDHSPTSSADINNGVAIPLYISMTVIN